jgi:tRNA pseudouridine-54 N-methylase
MLSREFPVNMSADIHGMGHVGTKAHIEIICNLENFLYVSADIHGMGHVGKKAHMEIICNLENSHLYIS